MSFPALLTAEQLRARPQVWRSRLPMGHFHSSRQTPQGVTRTTRISFTSRLPFQIQGTDNELSPTLLDFSGVGWLMFHFPIIIYPVHTDTPRLPQCTKLNTLLIPHSFLCLQNRIILKVNVTFKISAVLDHIHPSSKGTKFHRNGHSTTVITS